MKLYDGQLQVLQWIARGDKNEALPLEADKTEVMLEWLLDMGFVTYKDSVGSEVIITDEGRQVLQMNAVR